jgi:cytochrome c biogenesis protein CcdA
MRLLSLLALVFFVLGIAIMFEQFLVYGTWWSMDQVHHESFSMAAWGMAIVFFAVSFMKRPKRQVKVGKL